MMTAVGESHTLRRLIIIIHLPLPSEDNYYANESKLILYAHIPFLLPLLLFISGLLLFRQFVY